MSYSKDNQELHQLQSRIAELEAQLESWKHYAQQLTQWMHCMSYNDSYFGEPAGLVKQVTHSFNRLS